MMLVFMPCVGLGAEGEDNSSTEELKEQVKELSESGGKDEATTLPLYSYLIGQRYYSGLSDVKQDYAKAIHYYELSAKEGFLLAQYQLGHMYLKAEGVKQNYPKAFYWFELAAEQGFSRAQYLLGLMYGAGHGVKQDYPKAVYYFEQASEQNFAESQVILGQMYYNGEGVKQDYLKAKYYYNLAAKQGHKKAQEELKFLEDFQLDNSPF